MNNEIKECKYLGEYSGDCWLCSGNIFQKCMYPNKEKCLLLKNEQRKNKINELEQQLLAEQAKNKKLVEALEKIRWYKAIGKDVHKIQQIAAHAVTGIDVLENGLRGIEVNNAK